MKGSLLLCGFTALALGLGACGGDDSAATPDANTGPTPHCVGANCFVLPTAALKAVNGATESAPVLDCAAPTPMTSMVAINVSGTIKDFQTSNPVANATIEAFDSLDFSTPVAMGQADGQGAYMMTIPATKAKNRMNFRMKAQTALDTYALNIDFDVSGADITGFTRQTVATATAQALPAFIGVDRTPGLGVLAGVAVDCNGDQMKNAIATVSTTSSTGGAAPAHLDGMQVYYFSNGSTDLPVLRTTQASTNGDGLFVILEIPPTTGSTHYFLQTWGFKTDADVAMGMAGLSLISELESPVVGDSVISVEMNPNTN